MQPVTQKAIELLRIDPATGETILHASTKEAMTTLRQSGGRLVATYQKITDAGQWGAISQADYAFADGATAEKLLTGQN